MTTKLEQAEQQAERTQDAKRRVVGLAKQAEQEPVAWMQKAIIEWVKHPHNERNQTQVIVTGVKVFDGQVPLYAAPVRTKDLTDDEICKIMGWGSAWILINAEGVANANKKIQGVRDVIAADRELNR